MSIIEVNKVKPILHFLTVCMYIDSDARNFVSLTLQRKICKMYNTTLLKIFPARGKLGFISPARSLTESTIKFYDLQQN
jgi:hypothetical protein